MTYRYRKTDDGDTATCALCDCEAPLSEFDIHDLQRKFELRQTGRPTTYLLCEVCACTYCGSVLGSSARSADELKPIARMIATTANLMLDKLLKRGQKI